MLLNEHDIDTVAAMVARTIRRARVIAPDPLLHVTWQVTPYGETQVIDQGEVGMAEVTHYREQGYISTTEHPPVRLAHEDPERV